jgi:hypothetical protein
VAAVLVLALAAACTRSRAGSGAAPPVPGAATSGSAIAVTRPEQGATVTSPVRFEGRLDGPRDTDQLAAVIRSREPDGPLRWRGNGPLAVDADGRFSGVVSYTLEAPLQGVVQVVRFDPANGTPLDRVEVEVTLAASP